MKTYVFDIETYINYTLFAFMNVDTEEVITFEIRDNVFKKQKKLKKLLTRNIIVTFNGLKFDEPITAFALDKENVTSEDIYNGVQSIIVDKIGVFGFYRKGHIKPFIKNHIDIMDVAMGIASLKLYGARLGAKKLQDLPYEPQTELTYNQMDEVRDYCKNDLVLTKLLFTKLHADLELRSDMGERYSLNLMSLNGAKIAEKILVKETGYEGKAPDIPDDIWYKAPKYIKFKTKMMKEFFKYIKNHRFLLNGNGNIDLPMKLKQEKLSFGYIDFQLGIGGVHGSVENTTITCEDDESIVDIDYRGMYASLLIENKFVPKQISDKFLKVYKDIYNTRNNMKLKMKTLEKSSNKYADLDIQQNGLKLTNNSAFGRLGLRFSKLYDPSALLHITLTGQLTLMMVIEKLHLAGFDVFYANTDGITLKCKTKDIPKIKAITTKFDKKTGLVMEYNEFKSCHIRDVNNFVNITSDNKVKAKGAYADPSLSKNSQTPIIYDAVKELLQNGTALKVTINKCKDVNKFCSSVTVRGGAMYSNDIPEIYPDDWEEKLASKRGLTKKIIADREKLEADWVKDNGTYLGKVVRWYYSTNGKSIHYKKNGNKVGKTDGAVPMMVLTKKIPKDLDYAWYYEEAKTVLKDLGYEK